MRKLADEGTTMVVVTHEMDFARKVANWVVYMEDGVIIRKELKSKRVLLTFSENEWHSSI